VRCYCCASRHYCKQGIDSQPQLLLHAFVMIITHNCIRKQDFKERPRALEHVGGIVTDLYVDWHKLQGRDVKHNIPELQRLLSNYDQQAVAAFFDRR
jgi:hypothetical protein